MPEEIKKSYPKKRVAIYYAIFTAFFAFTIFYVLNLDTGPGTFPYMDGEVLEHIIIAFILFCIWAIPSVVFLLFLIYQAIRRSQNSIYRIFLSIIFLLIIISPFFMWLYFKQ